MNEIRPVRFRNLLAYGVGDLYGGGSFMIINLLFMFFMTDVIGIDASIVGLVFFVGKAWDAVTDPVMGFISDNIRTRFGRRRIFFLVGMPFVLTSFMALWYAAPFESHFAKITYYMCAYIFFSTSFTMVMIPYSALNAELTLDYKVRMRLSGARLIFSQGASLISGTIPKLIIETFNTPKQGYLMMGVIFGIFFMLPWIFVYWGTWELPISGKKAKEKVLDFFKNFSVIVINRSFRVHMGMYICAYTALDLMSSTAIYFVKYYLAKDTLYSALMGLLLVAQVCMLPVYVIIANRFGKGRAYIIGLVIWGSAMLFSLTLDQHSSTVILGAFFVVIGLGMSAGTMIPWAILPEVTDVDELITAKQRAGVYAGLMTFIRKFIQATTMALLGQFWKLIGYRPNVAQTPLTLQRMRYFYALAPASLIILGILIAFRFKITPKTHGILRSEIDRLKTGGDKSQVKAEDKAVCEMLTGRRYDALYPDARN